MSVNSISPHQPLQLTAAIANGRKNIRYPPPTAKYEDVVQSPDLFWGSFKAFIESIGIKLKVPTIGGNPLDLHRLFVEVTSRGGIQKIIKDRKWKDVIMAFNFGSTLTSASFVVRKYYLSLLFDFEQAYYFGKQARPESSLDSVSGSHTVGFASEEAAPNQGKSLLPGTSVTGVIDMQFDCGYLVTVYNGSEKLKGVLYRLDPTVHVAGRSLAPPPNVAGTKRRGRKRSRLAFKDPSRPKSNRSGYNFFFAEHYVRLKPDYQGQEKRIGRTIGDLWNNLTYAEKQVYQERGMQDKERYRAELLEYRTPLQPAAQPEA
jgi:hypothetical protein